MEHIKPFDTKSIDLSEYAKTDQPEPSYSNKLPGFTLGTRPRWR